MQLYAASFFLASVVLNVEGRASANLFEEWLAVQCSRFVPEPWIQTYTKIPQATRQCLIGRVTGLFRMFWNSQPVNIQQHLALTKAQCSNGFDKVQNLLNIIVIDFHKLTPLVQRIFAEFFDELAASGRKGFRKASVKYHSNWLKAHPKDQQVMASAFPKMAFFFNGPYSIPITHQALAVAQCQHDQISAFLATIGRIHRLAAKTNPPPPQGPYAALHQVVHEDFEALRSYVATKFPGAGRIFKQLFSLNTLWKLDCRD
ncbi:hypothetical protein AAVH_26286 [Aphelenchoides avenae]|nr:hypothetical protein AAVH_26286 [Aphelenchus avenae]